ncbi:MAG: Isopeptidase T, partial [uncultured Blastococcus sp.]
ERSGHRSGSAPVRGRLRGVRRGRRVVVPPPPLRAVRARRVLRLLPQPARPRPRGLLRPPGGPQLRARRGLVLELRHRAAGGRGGAGPAAAPSRRPAGTGPARSGAGRLAVAAAL